MNLLISYKVCKYTTHNYMCIRSISLFIVILWFALPLNAITYKEANECYKKGDYNQAIIDYKKLLKNSMKIIIETIKVKMKRKENMRTKYSCMV